MARPTEHELRQLAEHADYRVDRIERLRANRFLMTVADQAGCVTLILVQARPLVSSTDVHDLADLARLRRPAAAILLAYDGAFSPTAHQNANELRDVHIQLCTSLPSSPRAEPGAPSRAAPMARTSP